MNKTVSINLGGFFFHIDEDAYQKLNRYFDAIRRSLSPDGKDEIMNDIEGRIAELLGEKLKNDKQVVSIREVEDVIAVMGQPEDYRIDEEGTPAGNTATGAGAYYAPSYGTSKKFYRDGDTGMISGVCAGLAHYFRIDPLWIRIIFVISLFVSFGTSLFIYILLWILIPKAITTTEKLEMTGEPINISNIERKVREEFQMLGDKIQSVDYNKIGVAAKRTGDGAASVFMAIFKGFAKVIGALITIFSAVSLAGVIIAFFVMLFSAANGQSGWYPYMDGINYSDTPVWIVALLGLFAIGIPLFALFMLGLKILVENLRPIGALARYTLLILWLVSLGGLIYVGLNEASEVTAEGKVFSKQEIAVTPGDTLNVKFRYNDFYDKSVHATTSFRLTQDENGNDVIYSNDVELYLMRTEEPLPFIQIEKLSNGRSISEARKRAEKINYNVKIEGNNLILDNYLITGSENKFRKQKVELYLYLPEGVNLKPDNSVQDYDNTDNDFFDLWFDGDNYVYRMGKNKMECLNCAVKEQDGETSREDDSSATMHIRSDEDNVDVKVKAQNDSIIITTKKR